MKTDSDRDVLACVTFMVTTFYDSQREVVRAPGSGWVRAAVHVCLTLACAYADVHFA